MTKDLIERADALAAIALGDTVNQLQAKILALPAAPAWKSDPEFLASLREVPEGVFKDVRAAALREAAALFDGWWICAPDGSDLTADVQEAILALIPEAKP